MRGSTGSCRKKEKEKDKDIDKEATPIIASGVDRREKEHDNEKHIDSKVFPADGSMGDTLAV